MRFALKAAAIIVVLASLAAGAGILMSHREESGIHSVPSSRVPGKTDPGPHLRVAFRAHHTRGVWRL